jgi:phosphonate transport system substrate-binding protein
MIADGLPARLTRRSLLLGAAATPAAGSLSQVTGANLPIRFGLTPVFLTDDLMLLDRLKIYLEAACDSSVHLVTRRTYQEITALLVSGQLDAAWICGFPYVVYRNALELVAIPVSRGRPEYQSYLISRMGRRYSGLPDLAGDVHAFSDPDSNSGYLVTLAALAEEGLEPATHFRRSFFTYGHRNVIRAVSLGLAQSGSVDGYIYDVVTDLEPELTRSVAILRRSEWLGFPPVAAPARESVHGRTAIIRRALLAMTANEDGRAVLSMLRLDGFTAAQSAMFDGIAAKVAKLGIGGQG